MAKMHVIDGKTYVEVERQAEVGEKVVIIDNESCGFEVGHIGVVSSSVYADGRSFIVVDNKFGHEPNEYRVLVPVASEAPLELTANDIRWQPERVIDLLANLARRVSSLEQQLADTQNNVVRHGEELEAVRYGNNEIYMRLKGVEERTSSHRDELNVIDHEKAMIFEDIVSLSKRIKKLNGGAAE